MPRNPRCSSLATPLLVLSLLIGLMSLPDANSHLLDLLRPTVRAATNFTVNSTGDGADNNPGDGVCDDGTGACTLRAAIQEANTLAGDDTIAFAAPLSGSIITLNSVLPDINGNLNINGPGAGLLTVQRNTAAGIPNFRIIAINSGPTVTISGLTITNGLTASSLDGGGIFNGATLTLTDVAVNGNQTSATSGSGGWGGGISNGGTLTLNNCTVNNNRTAAGSSGGFGGGILNTGTLTLNDSTINGNQTGSGSFGNGGTGGGIFNQSGTVTLNNSIISSNQTGTGGVGGGIASTGTVTLTNSHVHTNIAAGNGGGIYNSGSLTLIGSTVSGNQTAFALPGGGIYNHISATLTLTNSTISGNHTGNSTSAGAGGYGGGVYSLGTMTVSGSTISGNQTGVGIMVGGYGGGVFNGATLSLTSSTISGNQTGNAGNPEGGGIQNVGTLTVTNVTITNNSALGAFAHGGGLNNSGGTINLQNTIVAGNFRVNNSTADDISGTVDAASSFNLIGTGGSGGLTDGVNNNQVGVADPRLGPLAANGGPTSTHALLVGSPAIDAGNSALTTDQRGQPRPIDDQTMANAAGGNASDIGAYEVHNLEVLIRSK
jgi:CSLREA domain-containing protein